MAQESGATSGGSIASAHKPPTEIEKLRFLIGPWRCDSVFESASGPVHTHETITTEPILDGFWYELHGTYDASAGQPAYKLTALFGYDQSKKKFINMGSDNVGGYWTSTADQALGPYTITSSADAKDIGGRGTWSCKSDRECVYTYERKTDGGWKKNEEDRCHK